MPVFNKAEKPKTKADPKAFKGKGRALGSAMKGEGSGGKEASQGGSGDTKPKPDPEVFRQSKQAQQADEAAHRLEQQDFDGKIDELTCADAEASDYSVVEEEVQTKDGKSHVRTVARKSARSVQAKLDEDEEVLRKVRADQERTKKRKAEWAMFEGIAGQYDEGGSISDPEPPPCRGDVDCSLGASGVGTEDYEFTRCIYGDYVQEITPAGKRKYRQMTAEEIATYNVQNDGVKCDDEEVNKRLDALQEKKLRGFRRARLFAARHGTGRVVGDPSKGKSSDEVDEVEVEELPAVQRARSPGVTTLADYDIDDERRDPTYHPSKKHESEEDEDSGDDGDGEYENEDEEWS